MIPHQLITELITCMENTFTDNALQQFTTINKELFGTDYSSATSSRTPLKEGITEYVKLLNQHGTIFYFIKEYCEKYKGNLLVQNFYRKFQDAFEDSKNGPFTIRSEFLDYILVNNNSLPFIGRHDVKKAVHAMLNNKKPRVTVLKGESRIGLSYIQRYLNEVAGRTQNFELIIVDLKDIRKEYAGKEEFLYASHIAAYIAEFLVLNTKVDAESKSAFKITPFIGQLRQFIQSNKKTYLFFIDQFDVPPANDVLNLILGIVKLSFDNAICCYTFLSGVGDNGLTDWPVDTLKIIRQQGNTIPVDSFDQAQLDLYFRKIYLYLSTIYNVPGTLQDFLNEINTKVIDASYFNTPNVETIGSKVTTWYENFCAQNS